MPLRSLNLLCHFAGAAPEEGRSCETCLSEAMFQYSLWGEHRWVCDAHIPQGLSILFHSDDPLLANLSTDSHCHVCRRVTDIRVEDSREIENRIYVRRSCPDCGTSWYHLRYADLAQDHIPRLVQSFSHSGVRIQCGRSAHHNLSRERGFREGITLAGMQLSVSSDVPEEAIMIAATPSGGISSLGGSGRTSPDQLEHPLIASAWRLKNSVGETVLVQQSAGVHVTLETHEGKIVNITLEDFYRQYMPFEASLPEEVQRQLERQAEQVGPVHDEAEPVEGSYWRRRRVDNTIVICVVTDIRVELSGVWVDYSIVHDPQEAAHSTRSMLDDQFVEHWTLVTSAEEAQTPQFYMPPVGSYWKNVAEGAVFRVENSTLHGRVNQEVRFSLASGGETREEKLRTFSRLHVELPYPPGDTLWARGRHIYWVSSWEGSADYKALQVVVNPLGGVAQTIPLDELYSQFSPLIFDDEVKGFGSYSLKSGEEWTDGDHTFLIFDVVFNQSKLIAVRFTGENVEGYNSYEPRGTTLALLPLEEFLEKMSWVAPPRSCEVGQRWAAQDESLGRHDLLVEAVDDVNGEVFCRILFSLERENVYKCVSYKELEDDYYLLEIKSVWDIFEEDD